MFYIRMADIDICIKNKYTYVRALCKDYIVEETEAQLTVEISWEMLDGQVNSSRIPITPGYAESICIYKEICKQLPLRFDAYFLHSAVIEYEGKGYAFSAKSGTGKSTHIGLWKKVFGDGVRVVNGDKPIIRCVDGVLYAYGTPWCGKECWQNNIKAPLHALCFLERAETNAIRRIDAGDALLRIFHQILTPEDMQTVDAMTPLLEKTLLEVPCYLLECRPDEQAAQVAYDGMKR
ncbi:MAG: hypothetical protein E7653_01410 [Ruminococcaceae bacterium]|nr:hypothetical protein [Oscillospiraceae bacterium]